VRTRIMITGLGTILAVAVFALGLIAQPQEPAEAEAQAEPAAEASQDTSCIACHGDAELFDDEFLQIVSGFESDVHVTVGISCHDCHGGNPDPALFEDYVEAKDEEIPGNPYRGVPVAIDQPAMCGNCHSDAAYMRRFAPAERVDQVTEYWTSRHGIALAAGDDNVARCSSCHGVHGILAVDDPEAPVYPTHVAATCQECHGSAERMAGYELEDGRALPTDQYARWRVSVHGVSLNDRQDISAPTCNDCHGNHGAAPPGGDSVSYVCGQCHGREAELFRNSRKFEGFEEHAEFLLDAGEDGCAACHEAEEPQSQVTDAHGFAECASCHGNHDVMRPTVAMLSPLPDTPCALCHEGVSAAVGEAHELGEREAHYEATRDELLARAADAGLQGDARFDWFVDRAIELEPHTVPAADAGVVSRPEFGRLFEKFRIGKTSYTVTDPDTGETRTHTIVRCSSCHSPEELIGEDYAVGRGVAGTMLGRMRELTTSVARAERSLLAARRGGVETRQAQEAIDQAVGARISLDALVHTFDGEGDFATRHAEGMEHAEAALTAGDQALAELDSRHRGLYWALLVIAVFLLALGLKIRELTARSRLEETG